MEDRKPQIGDKVIFKEKYADRETKGEVVGIRIDKDETFIQYIQVKTEWIENKNIEIDTIPTMKGLDEDEREI